MYQSAKFFAGGFSRIGGTVLAYAAAHWQALLFAQAGHRVTLHERSDASMLQSTSHWAGGMLAPYCEAEVSEPLIVRLGLRSLDLCARAIFRKPRFPRLAGRGASTRPRRL